MFGARCMRLVNPLTKNFLLMIMQIAARIICRSASPMGLFSKNAGTGKPHIICPIEKYMRTSRNPSEVISLLLSFGVSRSFRASSSAASFAR